MTDILSDILDTVALKAAFYFHTDYRPPFAVHVPELGRAARFHLNIQGTCHVQLPDGSEVVLHAGDLVLVPNGSAHILTSHPDVEILSLEDAIVSAGYSGVGPFTLGQGPVEQACKMVCGHLSFAEGADHPLLRAVPDLLHIRSTDRAEYPILDDVLHLIVRRMNSDAIGINASMNRLSEVLFIEMMRAGVKQAPEVSRLMSAVYDPHIGRALALIHKNVNTAWTVESLATAIGMSRSRFAERFQNFVGKTPMAYIAEWRLQRALHLLKFEDTPIKTIANQVGFQSTAAFSRAFTERFGSPPSQYTRRTNGRD